MSSIDKIEEKYIVNQHGDCLQKHNILNKNQHGFQNWKVPALCYHILLTKFIITWVIKNNFGNIFLL